MNLIKCVIIASIFLAASSSRAGVLGVAPSNVVVHQSEALVVPSATVMWSHPAPFSGRVTLEIIDLQTGYAVQRQYHIYNLPAGSTTQTTSHNNAIYLTGINDGYYATHAVSEKLINGCWVFDSEDTGFWEKRSP